MATTARKEEGMWILQYLTVTSLTNSINTTDIVEYFDEPKELEERVEKLCELVKQSNHFIVFTGAILVVSRPRYLSNTHRK